jgi:hypothetical protein
MSRRLERLVVVLCVLAAFAATSVSGIVAVRSAARHADNARAATRAAEPAPEVGRRSDPPPEAVAEVAAVQVLEALGVKPARAARLAAARGSEAQ